MLRCPFDTRFKNTCPALKVYTIKCHELANLIKSVSLHEQLRYLVYVQKLYVGTNLTFAAHHARVMHTEDVNGFVLAAQTEFPAQASLSELSADVTQQANNSLVSQLNAVGAHRVHGTHLAAFFAAMVVSLNCSR